MTALNCFQPAYLSAWGLLLGLASTLVPTPAIAASPAYKSTITADQLTQTWESSFTGPVTFKFQLPTATNLTTNVTLKVWVDGEVQYQKEIAHQNLEDLNGDLLAEYKVNLEKIDRGSTIKFEVVPDAGAEAFEIKTSVVVEEPSLVFITPPGNTIGQVGLFYNGVIYESHGPYKYRYDLFTDEFEWLHTAEQDNGVQKTHTLGTYLGLAAESSNHLLSWEGAELVPIPDLEAQKMAEWIDTQLHRSYIPTFVADFTTPAKQKGWDGGRYSEVGLIERAAEHIGINGGQGYIPNFREFLPINQIFGGGSGFGCTVVGCGQPTGQTQYLSVLSPELLYTGVVDGFSLDDWLSGWMEEVDFVLTAPDGQVLSYQDGEVVTNELNAQVSTGTFDRDAGFGNSSGQTCDDSPDPGNPPPREDLQFVQFWLNDRQPGQYRIQLTGKSAAARALIGNAEDGIMADIGDCFGEEEPEIIIPPYEPHPTVPEPSALLGLMALVGVGYLHRQR